MIQIHKKGFTLLELLVVIVIIALLLAILLPVFGRVREQGRRAQCISNLRQHGIAWCLYLDEHDEQFPCWTGGVSEFDFGGKKGAGLTTPAQSRILNPYLEIYDESSPNLEVFHCPDDKRPNSESDNQTSFDYLGTSYVRNPQFSPGYIKLSEITTPWDKLWLEIDAAWNMPGHGGQGDETDPKIPVMVLFMDSHVSGSFYYNEEFETGGGDRVLEWPTDWRPPEPE